MKKAILGLMTIILLILGGSLKGEYLWLGMLLCVLGGGLMAFIVIEGKDPNKH